MSLPDAPPKPAAPFAIGVESPLVPVVSKVQLLEEVRGRVECGLDAAELREVRAILTSPAFVQGLAHELAATRDPALLAHANETVRQLRFACQDSATRRAGAGEIVKNIGLTGGVTLAVGAFVGLFSITVNPLFAVVPALLGCALTAYGVPWFRRLHEEQALFEQLERATDAIISRLQSGERR